MQASTTTLKGILQATTVSSRFAPSSLLILSSSSSQAPSSISKQLRYTVKRYLSTAVAISSVGDEDEDELSLLSPTNNIETHQRPRLQALRNKLSKESTSPKQVMLDLNRAKAPKSDLSVDPTKKQDPTLDEILQHIKDMPHPTDNVLVDRFHRQHSYLRISLSEKCNLRCLYCMPEDGVPLQPKEELLSNDEILNLAELFVRHGVNKVRLTGGEPLLRKDLKELIQGLNQFGLEQIGMTTNGVTLSRHLPELVDAGLTHVNISLDSLDADKFAKLTRRPPSYHDKVLHALQECADIIPNRVKLNCVVLQENLSELQDFANLTMTMPLDVRFIEYMPFNENGWQSGGFVSYSDMMDQLPQLKRLQDGANDTTKWWTIGGQGRIGFITSMSEHFCGTCNRLRLTADGKLKVCLFGKTEVSLRDLMRRELLSESEKQETLEKLIHYSVQRKHFKLGGHDDMLDISRHSDENRPMTLIGG